jgi:hypothetical protein
MKQLFLCLSMKDNNMFLLKTKKRDAQLHLFKVPPFLCNGTTSFYFSYEGVLS